MSNIVQEQTYRPSRHEFALALSAILRFWERVDVQGPDECWPWTGGFFNHGYGQFIFYYKHRLAHRVALFGLNEHEFEEDALHSCDNPPCCNPKHLFPGNDKDNMLDAVVKGRIGGEAHPGSKLTEDEVREIRRLYAQGNIMQSELARRYSMDITSINGIVRGRTWRHVE